MNTKIILQVFIAALLLLPISVSSQKVLEPIVNPPQFKIHHVGYEDGLSSAFLVSAYQDRFGFVWIGGQYGLDVYDGLIRLILRLVAAPACWYARCISRSIAIRIGET